jgi:hypothetical protein
MKIILATWLEENQAETLTKAGAKNRLMSFHFLRQYKGDISAYMKRYAETGIGVPPKDKK